MNQRRGLSKKIRFEVFKRDGFKCQYCGRSAPDVVLHVDHVNPVSKGGTNDVLNLVTSCFECNSGKSDRALDDNSVVALQVKQLQEVEERRQQMEMIVQWRIGQKSIEEAEIEQLTRYVGETYNMSVNHPQVLEDLRKLLKKHGLEECIDAFDILINSYGREALLSGEVSVKKIGGIIYHQKRSEEDPIHEDAARITGACRKRFGMYFNQCYQKVHDALESGAETQELWSLLNESESWDEFRYGADYFVFKKHSAGAGA